MFGMTKRMMTGAERSWRPDWLAGLAVLLLLTLLAGAGASAQPGLAAANRSVDETGRQLETLEGRMRGAKGEELLQIRDKVRALREAGLPDKEALTKRRDELKADLDRLGPEPKPEDPPELRDVADERKRIRAELAAYEAVLRRSALNEAMADRLLADVADSRRSAFFDVLLRADPSPLSPEVIAQAARAFWSGLEQAVSAVGERAAQWREQEHSQRQMLWLGGGLLVALLLLFPVRNSVLNRIVAFMKRAEPSAERRIMAAAAMTFGRLVPWLLGTAILALVLNQAAFVPTEAAQVLRTSWFWLVIFLAVNSAVSSIFLTEVPGWQLLHTQHGRRVAVRAMLLLATATLGVDAVLKRIVEMLGNDTALALEQSALVAVVLAVLLFLLSRRSMWQPPAEARDEDEAAQLSVDDADGTEPPARLAGSVRRRNLRIILAVFSLVIVVATAIGQVSLGYFLATRAFFLIGLFVAGWAIRALVQEALIILDTRMIKSRARRPGKTDADRPSLVSFWIGLMADFLLVLVLVPPAFIVLGADRSDVSNFVRDAFTGFTIGSVRLSIADLLSGILIFVAVLAVTWMIQRLAENRLFPYMRVDPGVQHSFRTLIGYVGFVLAFVGAVGAIGFNLSSLAIVAGALSVGIGFGLQSIVNNFVSGLILLFERPIKIGDWVVMASGEGLVKKISVRSTEIETFDRASVIVPNSELISGTVTNLTHGNKMGRIIVPIGVSYNEDPEKVMRILEEIVAREPLVLRYPAPFINFANFGESSLDFEVRGFLRDVTNGLKARTALRVAIFKRFRQEGIEIPFPHRTLQVSGGLSVERAKRDPAPPAPGPGPASPPPAGASA
ncbi:MAG: mechanosensitive ion channel [Burkholderiaceae bacterium]